MSENFQELDSIWDAFRDPEYRHAYVSAHIGDTLALQLFSMRRDRGWTQKQLGDAGGIPQSSVSKLETSCENVSLSTLKKLAKAFDVALSVKFVPFSQLARDAATTDHGIAPKSFDDDNWACAAARPVISRTVAANTSYVTSRKWVGSSSAARPLSARIALNG